MRNGQCKDEGVGSSVASETEGLDEGEDARGGNEEHPTREADGSDEDGECIHRNDQLQSLQRKLMKEVNVSCLARTDVRDSAFTF